MRERSIVVDILAILLTLSFLVEGIVERDLFGVIFAGVLMLVLSFFVFVFRTDFGSESGTLLRVDFSPREESEFSKLLREIDSAILRRRAETVKPQLTRAIELVLRGEQELTPAFKATLSKVPFQVLEESFLSAFKRSEPDLSLSSRWRAYKLSVRILLREHLKVLKDENFKRTLEIFAQILRGDCEVIEDLDESLLLIIGYGIKDRDLSFSDKREIARAIMRRLKHREDISLSNRIHLMRILLEALLLPSIGKDFENFMRSSLREMLGRGIHEWVRELREENWESVTLEVEKLIDEIANAVSWSKFITRIISELFERGEFRILSKSLLKQLPPSIRETMKNFSKTPLICIKCMRRDFQEENIMGEQFEVCSHCRDLLWIVWKDDIKAIALVYPSEELERAPERKGTAILPMKRLGEVDEVILIAESLEELGERLNRLLLKVDSSPHKEWLKNKAKLTLVLPEGVRMEAERFLSMARGSFREVSVEEGIFN